MTEASRGVLDTSVLIDHDQITADQHPLKRLIIERTEGTPFFMEEMVQVLLGARPRNSQLSGDEKEA